VILFIVIVMLIIKHIQSISEFMLSLLKSIWHLVCWVTRSSVRLTRLIGRALKNAFGGKPSQAEGSFPGFTTMRRLRKRPRYDESELTFGGVYPQGFHKRHH
jgi:hypothetical protein